MDTIMIIRDSVAMCMNKTAEMCHPCVKEAGTCWQDIVIVGIVCAAIASIAIYAVYRYFKWKEYERTAIANAATIKRKNDVEDRQWKLSVDKEAHVLKRNEDKEDHERKRKEEQEEHDNKRKVDLQDKLLCYLKDLAEIERDADGNEITKYNDESKAYNAMLEKIINELNKANDKKA